MIGWHEDGDNLERMKVHEASLGKRFAVVRLYNQWRLPSRKVDQMVADGRLVISSHKPPDPRDGGWAAVAAGREDDVIRALARKYRSYGREIVFTFHHEPHDDASDVRRGAYGHSGQFKSAWRRIHRLFVQEGAHVKAGGNVLFAYIATGSQALAGRPAGSGDKLYPGGDVVDLLAHDRYNWASCRGDDWESFADNWRPLVDLAEAQGKPIIPGEFGAPPGRGRRNQWFREAAAWIKSDPKASRWMLGFAYYHSFHDSCHWDFMNQGSDGKLGWTDAFSKDHDFVGTPFSMATMVRGASEAESPPPAPQTDASRAGREESPSWNAVIRQAGGLPSGYGEMSGFAASKRYPGWAWGVRDSGNPASLYALHHSESTPGRFSGREFPVKGASNRDWEDIVYVEEAGGSYLYVIDTGAKRIYKIVEPNPAGSQTASVAAVYPYAFPDASPGSTCGPSHNVEAAFVYPALSGPLHVVRKMGSPAKVYRFDRLSTGRTNVPVPVGTLSDASCISVASVSADNRFLVTASHSSMRIRESSGSLASLLTGPVRYTKTISPDNNEGGDFFPWGRRNVVIAAENRNTWHFGNS